MLFLLIIALIGLYSSGLYYWYTKMTWSLKANLTQRLKQLHFLGAICCLLLLGLHLVSSLSLSSYLAIRIILGFTIITGISLGIIGHKSVFQSWEQYYFKLTSILPLLFLGLLLLPLLGIVMVLSFVGWFIGPEDEIYYEDSKIRVVSFFAGPLGPPHLGLYEKRGWLENIIRSLTYTHLNLIL